MQTLADVKLPAVKFMGREFVAPINHKDCGLTHALCGIHDLRGPMVVRWVSKDTIDEEMRLSVIKCYGSAVTRLTLVAIPKAKA